MFTRTPVIIPSTMRRTSVVALVLICGGIAACSGASHNPPVAPKAPRAGADAGAADGGPDTHIPTLSGPPRVLEERFFVDEGAPHPITCAEDKDCIGDTVPDQTGCCVRSQEAYPQTWAWHVWIIDRRLSGGCEKVACPPVPPPMLPKMCRLKVRCAERRCVDSCSEEPQPQKE